MKLLYTFSWFVRCCPKNKHESFIFQLLSFVLRYFPASMCVQHKGGGRTAGQAGGYLSYCAAMSNHIPCFPHVREHRQADSIHQETRRAFTGSCRLRCMCVWLKTRCEPFRYEKAETHNTPAVPRSNQPFARLRRSLSDRRPVSASQALVRQVLRSDKITPGLFLAHTNQKLRQSSSPAPTDPKPQFTNQAAFSTSKL